MAIVTVMARIGAAGVPVRQPTAEPTRASCIECTEKHLGAAYVLITEVRDGYALHRLLAIGHLHEAEDESQAWPELHDAIRAARKSYQQRGVVPDFAHLASLAAAVRAGG